MFSPCVFEMVNRLFLIATIALIAAIAIVAAFAIPGSLSKQLSVTTIVTSPSVAGSSSSTVESTQACSILTESETTWQTTAIITQDSTTYTIYTAYSMNQSFVPCPTTTSTSQNITTSSSG